MLSIVSVVIELDVDLLRSESSMKRRIYASADVSRRQMPNNERIELILCKL